MADRSLVQKHALTLAGEVPSTSCCLQEPKPGFHVLLFKHRTKLSTVLSEHTEIHRQKTAVQTVTNAAAASQRHILSMRKLKLYTDWWAPRRTQVIKAQSVLAFDVWSKRGGQLLRTTDVQHQESEWKNNLLITDLDTQFSSFVKKLYCTI